MTIGKIRKYAITCINRFTAVNNIPQGQFARASRDLMFIVVHSLTMPITQYGPTYSVPNRKLLLLYAQNQLAAVNKFTKTGWHAKTKWYKLIGSSAFERQEVFISIHTAIWYMNSVNFVQESCITKFCRWRLSWSLNFCVLVFWEDRKPFSDTAAR